MFVKFSAVCLMTELTFYLLTYLLTYYQRSVTEGTTHIDHVFIA